MQMIGPLITTIGILFLVVGLVGASIEIYAQLTFGILQQQLPDMIRQYVPGILQQGGSATTGGGNGPLFDPTDILTGLIQSLTTNPLWLSLVVGGTALIYFGLYISQRRLLGRR